MSLQDVKDVVMRGKWAVVTCRKTLAEKVLIDTVRGLGFDAARVPPLTD